MIRATFLPTAYRSLIVDRLKSVSNNTINCFNGVRVFLETIEKRSDVEIVKLLKELKEMIMANPADMKNAMPLDFNFFNNLEIVFPVGQDLKNALGEGYHDFLKIVSQLETKDPGDPFVALLKYLKNEEAFNRRMKMFSAINKAAEGISTSSHAADAMEILFDFLFKTPPAKSNGPTEKKSLRDQHIEKVGNAYESLKNSLIQIFADMAPAHFLNGNQTAINELNGRIDAVYQKVKDIRDLACTYPNVN